MRTTITLDPDVEALVKESMSQRGLTFKQAVNQAIRAGLRPRRGGGRFRTPTFDMGFDPSLPWDKALRMAGALEDDELARKLGTRK